MPETPALAGITDGSAVTMGGGGVAATPSLLLLLEELPQPLTEISATHAIAAPNDLDDFAFMVDS